MASALLGISLLLIYAYDRSQALYRAVILRPAGKRVTYAQQALRVDRPPTALGYTYLHFFPDTQGQC